MKVSFASNEFTKLLKLTKGPVTVKATDHKCYITAEDKVKVTIVPDADIEEPGTTVIDRSVLQSINKDCKAVITANSIATKSRKIDFIKCNSAEIKEAGTDAMTKVFEIPATDINEIYDIKYSISDDETRPVLSCICIDKDNYTALNGFQMAVRKHDDFDNIQQVIIPFNMIDICKKSNTKKPVEVWANNYLLMLVTDNIFIETKAESDEFIKYRSLLPTEYSTEVYLDAQKIVKLLKSYKNVKILKMNFTEDKLIIEAKDSVKDPATKTEKSTMTITDEIKIDLLGNPIEIAFNINYLLSALQQYKNPVLQMQKNVSPLIIKEDNKTDLVLPVRIIKE